MIIIGEKLNSSIPKTKEAIQNTDYRYLKDLIVLQESCGADFIDINTAVFEENELDSMKDIIKLTIENSSCGIVIDSPCVQTIEKAIEFAKTRPIIINSVTIDERIDEVCDIMNSTVYKNADLSVVGLPIKKSGIPETIADRKSFTDEIMELLKNRINEDKIWIDIIIHSVALSENNSASDIFETLKYMKEKYPNIKTTAGVTNISYGLPQRMNITASFFGVLSYLGLDSAIIDITNPSIKKTLLSTELLCGRDEFCMNYIEYIRSIQ